MGYAWGGQLWMNCEHGGLCNSSGPFWEPPLHGQRRHTTAAGNGPQKCRFLSTPWTALAFGNSFRTRKHNIFLTAKLFSLVSKAGSAPEGHSSKVLKSRRVLDARRSYFISRLRTNCTFCCQVGWLSNHSTLILSISRRVNGLCKISGTLVLGVKWNTEPCDCPREKASMSDAIGVHKGKPQEAHPFRRSKRCIRKH